LFFYKEKDILNFYVNTKAFDIGYFPNGSEMSNTGVFVQFKGVFL